MLRSSAESLADESAIGCIARGAHTRPAVQRIHFEPRVVRQHNAASHAQAVKCCFVAGISFKRQGIFRWSADILQPGQRSELYRARVSLCGGSEVAKFARVGSGNVKRKRHSAGERYLAAATEDTSTVVPESVPFTIAVCPARLYSSGECPLSV